MDIHLIILQYSIFLKINQFFKPKSYKTELVTLSLDYIFIARKPLPVESLLFFAATADL